MREAVPAHLPVSVKVRLGWDSGEKKFEIADAVQQAGATELVVHGRTKEQGYRAEHIDWQAIGEIRQRLNIPVIANGGNLGLAERATMHGDQRLRRSDDWSRGAQYSQPEPGGKI